VHDLMTGKHPLERWQKRFRNVLIQ
jgi:hypothetical protein